MPRKNRIDFLGALHHMKSSIVQDTNLVGTTMSSFLTVSGLLRISTIQKRSKRFCQEDLSVFAFVVVNGLYVIFTIDDVHSAYL